MKTNLIERTEQLFKKDFNCCQSILASFGPTQGLNEEDCLRLATGFAGGMNYQGKKCGAVVGAYLVLGLVYGNDIPNDELRKEFTYKNMRDFEEEFLKKYPSTDCNGLLGVDISTIEGFEKVGEEKLFEKVCPGVVRYAAELLEKIINANKKYTNGK